jgi:hypothetical protein
MKMTLKNNIRVMRILVATCGFLCIALAVMSAFFLPGDPSAVLFGILPSPWMEWIILAIALFSYDRLVISRLKSLSVEK